MVRLMCLIVVDGERIKQFHPPDPKPGDRGDRGLFLADEAIYVDLNCLTLEVDL